RGVPAVYVNYLDYDVFAHAFGPAHPAAMRALGRLDRSIGRLARVVRRLPELGYDLYVCSDHGQTVVRYFADLAGGRSIAEVILAMLEDTATATRGDRHPPAPPPRRPRGPARGVRERFFNHAARDMPAADVADDGTVVRVTPAGPNAFVYFTD